MEKWSSRLAHNQEILGSTPSLATKFHLAVSGDKALRAIGPDQSTAGSREFMNKPKKQTIADVQKELEVYQHLLRDSQQRVTYVENSLHQATLRICDYDKMARLNFKHGLALGFICSAVPFALAVFAILS